MKKILFVCRYNRKRSRTAEEIFKNNKDCVVGSAGLSWLSRNVLDESMVKWAETIFVMDKSQKEYIEKRFPEQCKNKSIVSLNIPDVYDFMDPELVKLLKNKTRGYF